MNDLDGLPEDGSMAQLIAALTILGKYTPQFPTHCIHDELTICGVGREQPTPDERIRLEQYGFHWSEEHDCWSSFRFGSG